MPFAAAPASTTVGYASAPLKDAAAACWFNGRLTRLSAAPCRRYARHGVERRAATKRYDEEISARQPQGVAPQEAPSAYAAIYVTPYITGRQPLTRDVIRPPRRQRAPEDADAPRAAARYAQRAHEARNEYGLRACCAEGAGAHARAATVTRVRSARARAPQMPRCHATRTKSAACCYSDDYALLCCARDDARARYALPLLRLCARSRSRCARAKTRTGAGAYRHTSRTIRARRKRATGAMPPRENAHAYARARAAR